MILDDVHIVDEAIQQKDREWHHLARKSFMKICMRVIYIYM